MSIDTLAGTLVWVGDPEITEFTDAFQFCISQAPQVALRGDLAEALRRPAAAVSHILIARATRVPIDATLVSELAQLYPQATLAQLQGPLCVGARLESNSLGVDHRIDWHRWQQAIPNWLRPAAAETHPQQTPSACRGVAILSASFSAAEPLLDLAQEAGVTAVWSREIGDHAIRNVDTVWWDDSLACPLSADGWSRRRASLTSQGRTETHAWIANNPNTDQRAEAIKGGIDVVLSKPYSIDSLLETIARKDAAPSQHSIVTLRAA